MHEREGIRRGDGQLRMGAYTRCTHCVFAFGVGATCQRALRELDERWKSLKIYKQRIYLQSLNFFYVI